MRTRNRVGLAAAAAAALLLLARGDPARADGGRPADRVREEEPADAPDDIRVGFRVGIWAPFIDELDARAQAGWTGEAIDLHDLGDLGDVEYAPCLGAWVDLGRWVSIDIDYVGLWLEGEGAVPAGAPLIFDGMSFAPGEPIDTRLSLHIADANLRINALDTEALQLGLRLGARYVHARTRLHATDRTARSDLDGVTPFIGAIVAVSPAEGVAVFGSVKAGLVDYDSRSSWWFGSDSGSGGREHRMLDAELGISLAPHERFGVVLSYRFMDLSLEREDDGGDREDFEAVLHGPQMGIFISF